MAPGSYLAGDWVREACWRVWPTVRNPDGDSALAARPPDDELPM